MEYFGRSIRLIYGEGNSVYLGGMTTFSNAAISPQLKFNEQRQAHGNNAVSFSLWGGGYNEPINDFADGLKMSACGQKLWKALTVRTENLDTKYSKV